MGPDGLLGSQNMWFSGAQKHTKVVRREVVSLERDQPQPLNLGEEVRSSNEHHQGLPTNADQEGMEEEFEKEEDGGDTYALRGNDTTLKMGTSEQPLCF